MTLECLSMPREDHGGALISVVWVVFLLSLMAMGVLHVTLSARQSVQSLELAEVDRRAAESALRIFMKEHFYNADEKAFLQDQVHVLGQNVDVRVAFESGKINLNRASKPLLSALFIVAGQSHDQARALAAAIKDWRDKDNVPEAEGAETEQYLEMGRVDGPRNGPFEAVGELRFVRGVTPTLYQCVQPLLTVSSLVGDVDIQFAGTAVRSVLQWAYDNGWQEQDWIDPNEIDETGGIIGAANTLGGQAMTLIMTLPAEHEKRYRAQIRFKSTSDMSYAYLAPVARLGSVDAVADCPW